MSHSLYLKMTCTKTTTISHKEDHATMMEYVLKAQSIDTPMAPENVIRAFDEDDRPRTRMEGDLQKDIVSVGRVREDEYETSDIKLVALKS